VHSFSRAGQPEGRHGLELAEASAAAREVFEEVDEALGQNLFQIMKRRAGRRVLTLTENAQPAIMANAIAVLAGAGTGRRPHAGRQGDFVAGHSLGEYTALCAAGAFSLADTARLLKLRGQAMQAAVPVGEGAMCALLGADIAKAQALADAAAEGEVCTVANDNDPTQVVLSGHKAAIERAVAMVKDHGIKRGVLLPVSAPFHCPLMQPAADAMARRWAGLLRAPDRAGLRQRHRLARHRSGGSRPPARRTGHRPRPLARKRDRHAGRRRRQLHRTGRQGPRPMIGRCVSDVNVTSVVGMADIEALAKGL
jgi:[acyl-carrier-protein] S-malonyltransferase